MEVWVIISEPHGVEDYYANKDAAIKHVEWEKENYEPEYIGEFENTDDYYGYYETVWAEKIKAKENFENF